MSDANGWYVVVNPVSGGGHASASGGGCARQSTACTYHTSTLATAALRNGYRHLLALGGDGTFNELINGLASQTDLSLAQCLALVAVLGTGNDWARTMQVPEDPDRLVTCLTRGRGRAVDIGVAVDASGGRRALRTADFRNSAE